VPEIVQVGVHVSLEALRAEAFAELSVAAELSDGEERVAETVLYAMMAEPNCKWVEARVTRTPEGETLLRGHLCPEFKRGFVARALRLLGRRKLELHAWG